MTQQTVATARGTAEPRRRHRLATLPAAAGVAFTASWVVGLSVFASSTDVHPTGANVVTGYAGHEGLATTQFLLTEGTASLALAVVAVVLGRAGLRAAASRLAWLTMGAGLAAAAIGLVQCVLGVYLSSSVGPAGHAGTAAAMNDAINRLDGAKMFILAVMAIAGAGLAQRTGLLPRWLRYTGIALAVAITASGVGYALLNNIFALAAWVSLPLLLVWVTGSGVVLGRSSR
jgi:hypothetical protein